MFKSRWITGAFGALLITLGAGAQGAYGAQGDDDGRGAAAVPTAAPMPEGRQHGGPGPMGGAMGGPMGEEQLDALIAVLKDANPEFAAKVERARKNNQREVRELLAPQSHRLFMMVQLKKNDPEIYALRIEEFKLIQKVDALAGEIRKAEKDGGANEANAKKLKELLNKQFDLRQQIQEKDLQRLQKKVQDLKERIERRKTNKEQMLVERFKEITEKSGERDW